ncbi:alpha/beta fold hydrolase [Micromonospora sp. DR5-3]|uniref:alpha/beta fold hydrolase n=1 Tax=unclassified Micromonospora TaxID=2617518 RepID=UPI0011DB104E|nr:MULTISPECIES: alpha/beta hydrolase [unclassified Micromonospora]MCW3820328.1 alpha/beta fold hydrolase [Micromonospora sp. DR5-3]TYC19598.1 alpha/beta fold hydrolase [Micromonospora sp. MP36]
MTRAPVEGTVRSADGTTIAYERSGSGPTVVMVDAAGGFREMGPMRPLAALLADEFTVVCYDRRGRGGSSDTAPYHVDREVDDLRALVAEVGAPACLFGFSSGAVLALVAAARGLPVERLALLEPPLDLSSTPTGEPGLAAEIAGLVAAGRRGDAVAHFQASIGVPAELTEGMRESPWWPALERLAHTLVYDLTIVDALPADELAQVTVPTLVVDSEQSDARLREWAAGVAAALPHSHRRSMRGDWHQVPEADLAPALADFFAGRANVAGSAEPTASGQVTADARR